MAGPDFKKFAQTARRELAERRDALAKASQNLKAPDLGEVARKVRRGLGDRRAAMAGGQAVVAEIVESVSEAHWTETLAAFVAGASATLICLACTKPKHLTTDSRPASVAVALFIGFETVALDAMRSIGEMCGIFL